VKQIFIEEIQMKKATPTLGHFIQSTVHVATDGHRAIVLDDDELEDFVDDLAELSFRGKFMSDTYWNNWVRRTEKAG